MGLPLYEEADFISKYAASLLASGAYVSRVMRSASRIATALGLDIKLVTGYSNVIISIEDEKNKICLTKVVKIPAKPISFETNADLCCLSWKALDNHMSLAEIKEAFDKIMAKPRIDSLFVLFMVGFANASFCRLFGGDFLAMAIVFSSTLAGFSAKQILQKKGVNEYIVFIISAFLASICASSALCFNCTAEIAVAASVLFLVPGVLLINGVLDILDGYAVFGCGRLIGACLLVICIAIGLSISLLIAKGVLM